MRSISAFCFVLLLTCARASAEDSGIREFSSYVVDAQSQAGLSNVHVVGYDPCMHETNTDDHGHFVLACPGSLTRLRFRLEHKGYAPRTVPAQRHGENWGVENYELVKLMTERDVTTSPVGQPAPITGPESKVNVLGITSLVAVGLGAAATVIFWRLRESAANDFNAQDGCGDKLSSYGAAGCEDLFGKTNTFERATTIAGAATGVSAALAFYFFVLAPKEGLGVITTACSPATPTYVSCRVQF